MNFLWALAVLVLSAFIQALITPKSQAPSAAAFEAFDFPQIDEGTPQAVIFGDAWVKDWHVLWFGNYRTKAIKSGGSSKK